MHPMMKPALRRAWRDRQSVQVGVTSAHAVTVGPVDTATGSLIELLDGTRGLDLLRAEARTMGLPDGRADALVGRLAAAGLLDDPTAGGPAADSLRRRPGALDRLRPDLASLSVVHPEPGGAMRRLAARRAVRVQVRGAGRVGALVAATLSSAGVGRVEVLDGGFTEPGDVTPGGLAPEEIGQRRDAAARRLVRRSAPDRPPRRAEVAEPGGGEPALALVVVAPRDGLDAYAPDPLPAEDWIAAGIPHLYAGVVEATGVVGPLVVPGSTACAGCLERCRTERDPARSILLAQWRSGRRAAVPSACDAALATTVAGLTACHAVSFLDGDLPASADARWEVSLPSVRWRSERISAHAECPCGAAGRTETRHTSGFGPTHETMAG
ncbi:ThiF family adenylyltransferase [Streptomyces sp. ISL-10]|uniref:ThiF family adenylyltransferase n=1 Tax=Streptomyces sp. ISL-10 TaxID=2819172 RepID=UPI001BE8E16B|nr:ThiF family adenylyltransferase [Streptomyces sp. ISL-10]MBT2365258.1 ThiF family adenylyltransferase [Streptomyces sp. ISL-10]